MISEKAIAVFEKYVIKNERGCWDWSACKMKGYGAFYSNYRYYRVPRFSYELHRGTIPPNMLVLHKCDNPSCSNPDHLFLGTYLDNSRDCISKGRRKKIISNAKLNAEQIKEIRLMLKNIKHGENQIIAKKFGIHPSTLSDLKYGRTWKDLL